MYFRSVKLLYPFEHVSPMIDYLQSYIEERTRTCNLLNVLTYSRRLKHIGSINVLNTAHKPVFFIYSKAVHLLCFYLFYVSVSMFCYGCAFYIEWEPFGK